jgi:pyruvate/2-oxoglutarate dehydrogenase complex dihydrolipoamide acyltransferase (E2) component
VNYKLVGDHPEDLADGRVIGVGERIELDEETVKDPHNQSLLDDGKLIEVEADQEPPITGAARDLAAEHDIPLNALSGTGADGRITLEDVERYVTEQNLSSGEEGS